MEHRFRKKIFVLILLVLSGFAASSAHATPIVLQPADGKDTQLANDILGDDNWNTLDLIMNWSDNLRSIGLLEFDLTGIPSGLTVNSATLSLFHWGNENAGITYSIFRVTSPWDEDMVTFNTAPSIDPTEVASLTINDNNTGVYRDWDITSLVAGWMNASYANYGLWIEETPIQGEGSAYFYSSEQGLSTAPRLTISAVPLPAAVWLFGSGLLGVLGLRKKATL
ncbi:MAG: DNRLRE domain-containing protein [Methylococcaceae bacterium]|nr:DNRLRE domain-containing protein [Methylococcaceae bacterium]